MTTTIKLTEADVQNCTWTVVEVTPTYRRSIGRGTHPVTGVPIEVMQTEFLAEDELLTLNTEERNSRDGKRWSDGAGTDKGGNVPMVRVGRIPLNKFFSDIAAKLREGDHDHLKWWLKRDENQPFRTKSGGL
jgi:hypothetical protein